jgi:arsenate reductase
MSKRVLFICIHNSARSQMAEALLRRECGDAVHVESAGLTPGSLNSLAVEALQEIGIDISNNPTRSVFDVYKSGALFSHVITVCDESSAERCPVFPGVHQKLHWNFADPSKFEGTHEEKIAQTREVRNAIEARIKVWCLDNCAVAA